MTDEEMDSAFCQAVELAIQERLDKGLYVVRYDTALRKVYLEFPDGHTEYVEE